MTTTPIKVDNSQRHQRRHGPALITLGITALALSALHSWPQTSPPPTSTTAEHAELEAFMMDTFGIVSLPEEPILNWEILDDKNTLF
jgi:hypothetical protein